MKTALISCGLLILGIIVGIYAVVLVHTFDDDLASQGSSLNLLLRECRHRSLTEEKCIQLISQDSFLEGQFDLVPVDESRTKIRFETIQSGPLFSRQSGFWQAELEKDSAGRIVRSRTEFLTVQSSR